MKTSHTLPLVGLLALAGCQTVPPARLDMDFPADVFPHRAVLQYRPKPEAAPVHAEAVLRFEAPSKLELVAWKGPMAWVVVQMNASAWRVEFPAQRRCFSGRDTQRVPAELEVWLALRTTLAKTAPRFSSVTVAARDGAALHLQFPGP
jgi:hypothetical protein